MTTDLTGLRALVAGASKGIGKAIAIALAENGASVTLLARSENLLEQVRDTLVMKQGQRHYVVVTDIRSAEVIQQVEKHVDNHGGFHIVVNNTAGPNAGELIKSHVESLTQAFHDHILVSHELMQLLSPFMKAEKFGRFINIISTSVKQPIEGLGVSNIVRGAMASWSKTLATELAPFGVTVNNILPGATLTNRLETIIARQSKDSGVSEEDIRNKMIKLIPVGRFADPSEIAHAALFLASREASYITGTSILVDGGRMRSLS
ncbi:MAG: SDR family oxidoreductase [Ignavibacteria bacterium]|nr:SDR family oxidoreductase [Ignavibacteria bacterium]